MDRARHQVQAHERRLRAQKLYRLWRVGPAEIGRRLGVSRERVYQYLDPAKHRARRATKKAIRRGTLVRPRICDACGKPHRRIEAHHRDYSKRFEIDWLCPSCHAKRHR